MRTPSQTYARSVEVARFLNQLMGLQLSPANIAALEARTEGWIAGLQLAALSLQGRSDVEHFIAAFTGSNRYIISQGDEPMDKIQAHTFLIPIPAGKTRHFHQVAQEALGKRFEHHHQ